MSKWTQRDTEEETEVSRKEASEAWHTARDQAAEEGGWGVPEDRHDEEDGED